MCALLTASQRRPWIDKARDTAAAVPPDWHRALPPVFIVGFWRSGATLLHELLAADRGFAAPLLVDVLCPSDAPYLHRWKRRPIGAFAPPDRGVDHVRDDPSRPQEDEIALRHLGAPSFFAASCFPRRREEVIEKALFFDGDPDARDLWRDAHARFLGMLVVKYPERRLLLKNPANSTRIPDLLELYPDALFVRIDREADDVLPSFVRMTAAGDRKFSLQGNAPPLDPDAARALHARVMAKLDADWTLIAPDRRARVCCDSLRLAPLRAMDAVYGQLALERTERAARRQKEFWLRHARRRKTWAERVADGR